MDDLLTGTNSIEAARKLRNELNEILVSAGVELLKWASNNPCALDDTSDPVNDKIFLQS